jgi:hypothetical protein
MHRPGCFCYWDFEEGDRSAFANSRSAPTIPMSPPASTIWLLLYQAQGRYADAELLLVRSLAIKQKMLPENHPRLQLGWDNFRSFLQAVVQANRVAELSDHPLTQALLQDLPGAQNDA